MIQKKISPRCAALSLSFCLAVVLGGCGGGSNAPTNTSAPAAGTGSVSEADKSALTVSIDWPQPGTQNRSAAGNVAGGVAAVASTGAQNLIPAQANRIVVKVTPAKNLASDALKLQTVAVILNRPATAGTMQAKLDRLFPGVPLLVTAEARRVATPGTGIITAPTAAQLNEGTLLASGTAGPVILKPRQSSPISVELGVNQAPVADDRVVIGGSVTPDEKDPTTIIVALNALLNKADGAPLTGLTPANFAVYEDGIRRQIVSAAETGSGTTTSRADIAFVIDTTGSMGGTLDGVQDSVAEFADFIAAKGVDVRLAGVPFRDDVGANFNFTNNVGAFKGWVKTLDADGGGDSAENALDGIVQAFKTLSWREGAQHLIVVITDDQAHTRTDGSGFAHFTAAEVTKLLTDKGYVLHSVSPVIGETDRRAPRSNGDAANRTRALTRAADSSQLADVFRIARLTGGTATPLPDDGIVNLTRLPLAQTVLKGYTVKFRSVPANSNHVIRLVVSVGGVAVADKEFNGRY